MGPRQLRRAERGQLGGARRYRHLGLARAGREHVAPIHPRRGAAAGRRDRDGIGWRDHAGCRRRPADRRSAGQADRAARLRGRTGASATSAAASWCISSPARPGCAHQHAAAQPGHQRHDHRSRGRSRADSVVVHDGELEVTTPGQADPWISAPGEGLRQPAAPGSAPRGSACPVPETSGVGERPGWRLRRHRDERSARARRQRPAHPVRPPPARTLRSAGARGHRIARKLTGRPARGSAAFHRADSAR